MNKKTQNIILILASVVFLIYAIGFVISPTTEVEISGEVDAGHSEVYDLISNPSTWPKWSPITPSATSFRMRKEGPDQGVGAKIVYLYDQKEALTISITETRQGLMVRYDISSVQAPQISTGEIALEPVSGKTRIVWTHESNWGKNPIMKLMGKVMVSKQRNDMLKSLENMQNDL
ncbi:MAG: hypothetical protein EA412_08345 [Chitinophagaceae bacterium]|nr:MAG: hypothetical protein EA412_08345 [Chitinophagaceae bacterium]